MDFLKTRNTNAQAIAGFEAVAFQAFSVVRDPTQAAQTYDWAPSEDTRAVEADLRRDRHVVVRDASRAWIWFFEATAVDRTIYEPTELPAIVGYTFKREQHGVMKASELARPPLRSASHNANLAMATASPLTLGLSKGLQTPTTRLAHGQPQPSSAADQSPYDGLAIYELFTSAVVALLSHHFVKDLKAVPMNCRTFLTAPTDQPDLHTSGTTSFATPYCLTNLDVFWASSGTLVVSTFSLAKPNITCLADIVDDEAKKVLVNSCVRLAPNGKLAQLITFDDPMGPVEDESSHRFRRKRPKTTSPEVLVEQWKSTVKRWLAWKGHTVAGLDDKDSWVRVSLADVDQSSMASPVLRNNREIMWPKSLCFTHHEPSDSEAVSVAKPMGGKRSNALEYFGTESSTGFRDPVDAAKEWFLGKVERDKVAEAHKRAKRAEEDAARAKEDITNHFPSSPLNARFGNYGDLQAVSGVYPTPPDGLPVGTTISNADTPSVSGAAITAVFSSGGGNPLINISAPHDASQNDAQQVFTTSPDMVQSDDQYAMGNDNDDLFEDEENEGFEGNGITDADFNFFDQPDDDDVDMLNPSAADETNLDPNNAGQKEHDAPSASRPETKSESSDPMAALESILASATTKEERRDETGKLETLGSAEAGGANAAMTPTTTHAPNRASGVIVPVSINIRRMSSPTSIAQALLPPPDGRPEEPSKDGANVKHGLEPSFDPVSFSREITLSDAKYKNGRFSFAVPEPLEEQDEPKETMPPSKSLRDMPLVSRLRYVVGAASKSGIPELPIPTNAESDLSDTSSETSSLLDDTEPPSPQQSPLAMGFNVSVKRKLPTEGNATPLSVTSLADSFRGDVQSTARLFTDETALSSLEPTSWDWPMVNAPSPSELCLGVTRYSIPAFSPQHASMPNTPRSPPDMAMDVQEEKPVNGKDSIAIAQIVTAQIVSETLNLVSEGALPKTSAIADQAPSEHVWQNAIQTIFPSAFGCDVTTFASIHDVFPDLSTQAKSQQRLVARKANESAATISHQLHQVSPPLIRFRRGDTLWDLLPPALAFWEPLGLSSCSPTKNVVAFAVYPHNDSLRFCVDRFMANMQLAFDGCRLGSHRRVDSVSGYQDGLVPFGLTNASSVRNLYKALHDSCVELGKLLATQHGQMRDKDDSNIDAFVIYVIDAFENPAAIWRACSAFWALFQAYGQAPSGRPESMQKPDLVLQLVPIRYVASIEAPIVLDANVYSGLAREVYDRCPPSEPSEDKMPLSIYTAPAFQLEEPIPRSIPFKLNAEPPQDLLHENSYIHLGYAISLDGMWVTAAWTDICGKSQTVVSYHLGSRMFGEIAKEIWQTTIEILQARRVTWRVCIAKAGVMDREEMEAWVFLVSCPTQLNLFITLLTVDRVPRLKFTPSIPDQSSSNALASGQPVINTPASTPQAGVSPEHGLTPAATPSTEVPADPLADPDARLADATDETWAIILAHRLHNSHSTNEFRPALISGLLIKRGYASSPPPSPTSDPESSVGPIIVAVNILWMGAVNPTRATTSPFPTATGEGISPGGVGLNVPQSPSLQERSYSSLTWTPTTQTRAAAENLLKEVLGQYRGLGLLARLRGMRGTRHGTVPWHVVAAVRGVEGLAGCASV